MKKESTKFIEALLPRVDYLNDFSLKLELFRLVRIVRKEMGRKEGDNLAEREKGK